MSKESMTVRKTKDTIYMKILDSSLGKLYLAADESALKGLWMEDQKYYAATVKDADVRFEDTPVLEQTARWLERYFNEERPDPLELPLSPDGSDFRKLIWKLLLQIPYGETRTYKELAVKAAKILGKEKMASQAVGGAVGHNPIGIIIPCHRVIGSDGSLIGYAGGLDKKEWLLHHEKVCLRFNNLY